MNTYQNTLKATNRIGVLLLGIFLFLCTACDPVQSLVIENKTNAKASITFVFKDSDSDYVFKESSTSDTLIIELDTNGNNASRRYRFGLGNWKILNSLDSLVSVLESIEIKTWKSTETFQGETQIRAFLKSNLLGRKKESINIILE